MPNNLPHEHVITHLDRSNANLDEAQLAYIHFLKSLGIWDMMEDEPRRRTPERVVEAYLEMFGTELSPLQFTTFPVETEGYGLPSEVLVKDIPFMSLCAHHHMPFIGTCSVRYQPDQLVVGLSKIPRLVTHVMRGATIQEEACQRIGDFMQEKLAPLGVEVCIDALHTCVSMRGANSVNARTHTNYGTGIYRPILSTFEEMTTAEGDENGPVGVRNAS